LTVVIFAKSGIPPWLRRFAARLLSWVPQPILARCLPRKWRFNAREPFAVSGVPATKRRLYIGPANSAAQSWGIARVVERNLTDVGAVSMAASASGGFQFPADYKVPVGVYHWSKRWMERQRENVEQNFTHVIAESGRRLFGDGFPGTALQEIRDLTAAGVSVALVFYGSDIRLPSRHAAGSEWSPFHGDFWALTPQLERNALRNARLAETAQTPVFVVTPDLLLDLPDAKWLPLVIDTDAWTTESPPLSGAGLPRVAHAPTNTVVKGSDLIDPILTKLESEGLLEYVRVRGVSADEMRDIYKGVDIVLDQFRMGIYGVAACEAMAAGRVLISHVGEFTRDYVQRTTGLTVPIVQATPDTLESVLRAVIATPADYLAIAASGVSYARELHDGRRSAAALEEFLAG
jgi:hypothetical protein